MKHIKLFEQFIAEKKDEKYIAYVDDKRKPGGSDKEIKKDYNLDVEDRTSSGFSIVGAKEDIEAFIADYSIILDDEIQVYETRVNEDLSKSEVTQIEKYLSKLDASVLFDMVNDFYSEDDEWNEIKNDLDKSELEEWALAHIKSDAIKLKDLKSIYESTLNEGNELSQEEYRKYYPILGHKGAGLEFNFNGQTVGGYVVPKAGEDIEALIAKIEKASKKKLTAVPYNQETGQFASGVGNDTWMKSGKTKVYLQIIKK